MSAPALEIVATDLGPIAVRRMGAGRPVLWVHGYTLDSTLWKPLWRELPGWTHLGLDLPGHGRSRDLASTDRIGDFAAAVQAVADRYDVRDLCGLSFGGTVCLQLAVTLPHRFDRMVLCAPALPGGPVDQEAADCNQQLLRLHAERGVGRWLADRWLAEPPAIFSGARRHPELFAAIEDIVTSHRWGELALGCLVIHDGLKLAKLAAVPTDTLVLLGDNDIPSFARTAELLRRKMQRVDVAYVAGAGHLAPLERPAAAATAIARFLARPIARR